MWNWMQQDKVHVLQGSKELISSLKLISIDYSIKLGPEQ